MKLALLTCLLFCAPVSAEPIAAPKAKAPCDMAKAPAVVVVARPLTFLERIRERRMARLAWLQERSASRGFFLRVGMFRGACCGK